MGAIRNEDIVRDPITSIQLSYRSPPFCNRFGNGVWGNALLSYWNVRNLSGQANDRWARHMPWSMGYRNAEWSNAQARRCLKGSMLLVVVRTIFEPRYGEACRVGVHNNGATLRIPAEFRA
ncbi:predicted protein [Histoplasma capsulatum var. duboisii H88]|uniref:Predicted protein n=2 Tax=Ajellomyces capsulatus TaxID=5037 RepID=F0UMV6_AJEC8|nr:predicted protein [Histoplasma capsulatum H143]EGC47423.1 predicted protein [Histoplasma capsulatum var. duboisii H88]